MGIELLPTDRGRSTLQIILRILVISLLAGLVITKPINVWACTCVVREYIAAVEYEKADDIFSGRVASVNKTGSMTYFEVAESFKGAATNSIKIHQGNACQIGFSVGKSFLVFAERQDGKLWTSACSPSGTIEWAAEKLQGLRKLRDAKRSMKEKH